MEFTAKQIADLLQGQVVGNQDEKVSKLAKIEEATQGSLTFLANPKYESFIYSTKASIVIVSNEFVAEHKIDATLVKVNDPYKSFAVLLDAYNQLRKKKKGIEQHANIHASAKIGEDSYIGSFVYVGENSTIGKGAKLYPGVFIDDNVHIGDDTVIYAGAKVYYDCVIGKNCTIHAGVVIGADGFGFAPQDESNYLKVAQIGNVIIEDYVEIGSNTTIDRATLGSTIIRKGVKLDNLIQIAHNVEIGEHTVIAAQTGIAGSTKIGKFCMIGGQVGIVGHITIADKVKIAAQSGIGTSIINVGEIVQGSPAFFIGDYKKSYVGFRKLPEIQTKIEQIEKLINELKISHG
jgi:UDP-3-O-[3-hydroxymyristoyl] glucosamine N-acyltransferase